MENSRCCLFPLLFYSLHSMNLLVLQRICHSTVFENISEHCFEASQMRWSKRAENELIQWATVLILESYVSFFFWFFVLCARQSLLCCQAAECFVKSWAAWKGYIRARSQIDQSFQLQPKAATKLKLGLDHAVVIYKAYNREMEESTWASYSSLHLYISTFFFFFSFPLALCLTASLLSVVSLLLLYPSVDQLGNTNRCRFSASTPGWPFRDFPSSSNKHHHFLRSTFISWQVGNSGLCVWPRWNAASMEAPTNLHTGTKICVWIYTQIFC